MAWASSSSATWSARGCWRTWWMFPSTGRDPVHDFEVIMAELASFSDDLAAKPMIVVATKIDAAQDPKRVAALQRLARKRGMPFFKISSVTGDGIAELKRAMAERVLAPSNAPAPEHVVN